VLATLPGESDPNITIARSLSALGRWDETIAAFERSAEADPEASSKILEEIADVALSQRQPGVVARLYGSAIREMERRGEQAAAEMWSDYGAALRSAGRHDDARKALDRALIQYDAELARPEPKRSAQRGRAKVVQLLDGLGE